MTGKILIKLRRIAFEVACNLYCGFVITIEVPCVDIFSNTISSSAIDFNFLSSLTCLERTKPDFSPFVTVFT